MKRIQQSVIADFFSGSQSDSHSATNEKSKMVASLATLIISSLVPRLTVRDKKLGRSLGTRLNYFWH